MKDYATKSAAIFFSRKYQSSDHIIRKTAKIEEMIILVFFYCLLLILVLPSRTNELYYIKQSL